MNYMDEEGMKLNSYAKRGGISLKVNQKLRDNLDIHLDTRYSDMRTMGDEGTTNGSGSLLSSSYRSSGLPPVISWGSEARWWKGKYGKCMGVSPLWDTYSPVAHPSEIMIRYISI